MNLPTVIVIIVIAAAFVVALIASRRHGGCDPSSCDHCPHSADGCCAKGEGRSKS